MIYGVISALLLLQRNEITREDFIRGARVIAGDQVLVQTIRQMHMKACPNYSSCLITQILQNLRALLFI